MRVRKKHYTSDIIEASNCILDKENAKKFDDIILEIGCGKAGLIIKLASDEPQQIFIGLEKEHDIIATALKQNVIPSNLFFLVTDVDFLLEYLPLKSVKKIYINFPDPWPKKRHHKRRLLTAARLTFFAQFLKDEAQIEFKSDKEELYQFALTNFPECYQITSHGIIAEGKYSSEYEQRFRSLGQDIFHINAKIKKL